MEGVVFVVDRLYNNQVTRAGAMYHKSLDLIDVSGIPEVWSDDGTHAMGLNLQGDD